jgi:hypothetical protein
VITVRVTYAQMVNFKDLYDENMVSLYADRVASDGTFKMVSYVTAEDGAFELLYEGATAPATLAVDFPTKLYVVDQI